VRLFGVLARVRFVVILVCGVFMETSIPVIRIGS
jgi:hypothetical protein